MSKLLLTLTSFSLASCSQVSELTNAVTPKKNTAIAQPALPAGIETTHTGLKSRILRAGQGGSTPN